VTRAISRIALGMQEKIFMGNLSSRRDWGHAKDYIKAMYLILQQDQPDDYVIATGITTSIRDFITKVCLEIGLEVRFSGEGAQEVGCLTGVDEKVFCKKVGERYLAPIKARISKTGRLNSGASDSSLIVAVDPAYFRPTEVDLLIGDSTKARTRLGWQPEYNLDSLITDMMQSDIKLFQKDFYLREGGFKTLNYFE